jgi:hypothetical protein
MQAIDMKEQTSSGLVYEWYISFDSVKAAYVRFSLLELDYRNSWLKPTVT